MKTRMETTSCYPRWQMMIIPPNCPGRVNQRIISSAIFTHSLLLTAAYVHIVEYSWTTSVLRSMIASKHIDVMLCPSKQSGRSATCSGDISPSNVALRQVIQQATGQQVSQPVAQIVAGFSKVFVGEIIEKGSRTLFCSAIADVFSHLSTVRAGTAWRCWPSFPGPSARSVSTVSI